MVREIGLSIDTVADPEMKYNIAVYDLHNNEIVIELAIPASICFCLQYRQNKLTH